MVRDRLRRQAAHRRAARTGREALRRARTGRSVRRTGRRARPRSSRPVPWPCRSGRRGCPRSGRGAVRPRWPRRRPAVAGSELVAIELDLGRADRDPGQMRQARPASDSIVARSSSGGWATATPTTDAVEPARGARPAARPAWRPSPMADHDGVEPDRSRCGLSDDLGRRPGSGPRPRPPHRHRHRSDTVGDRPRAARRRPARRARHAPPVGRRGLMDGRAEQLVEPLVRIRRIGRRAGQHQVDAEPGPGAAAAVSRRGSTSAGRP